MQWYYSKNGTPCGPVDDAEIRRLARSGEISQEDLLWNATMGDQWQPASSFSFLFFQPVDLQPPAIPSVSELEAETLNNQGKTSNRYLMGRARTSLKGRWGMAVLATIIYLGIFMFFGFIGALFTPHPPAHQATPALTPSALISSLYPRITLQILQLCITAPLLIGLCTFFLGMARRTEISLSSLFSGFQIFWKAIGLYFLVVLLSLFWMLLALSPMIAMIIWTRLHHLHQDPVMTSATFLLGVLGIAGAMVKLLGYSMSYFIIADQPSTGPLISIRKSQTIMQGKKWKLLCLQLRFLGWWLLGLLTCGIGYLWIIPYIFTAKAHFYLDVKDCPSSPNV